METTTLDFSDVWKNTDKSTSVTKPVTGLDFSDVLTGQSVHEPVIDEGESGLKNIGARYEMARGSNFAEKETAFKKYYGEDADLALKVFPGSDKPVLAFREGDTDKWKRVDKKFLDMDRHEFLRDLIDIAGEDLESIIGEIIAVTKFTPAGRAVSLFGLGTKAAIGAGAGELSKELIDSFRGTQQETAKEIAIRTGAKSGLAGVSAPLGEVVTRKITDIAKGGSTVSLKKGAREAIDSARALDVPVPPLHYLVAAPWLQKLGGQAQAVAPKINLYIDQAKASNESILRALTESGVGSGDISVDLLRIAKVADQRVASLGEELLIFQRNTPDLRAKARSEWELAEADLAKRLREALADADRVRRAAVDVAYMKARAFDNPDFDLDSLRSEINNILYPPSAKRFKEVEIETVHPGSSILDPSGNQIIPSTSTVAMGEDEVTGVAVPLMSAQTLRILKEIAETSRIEAAGDKNATWQLERWAHLLSQEAIPGVGEKYTNEHRLARQALKAVRNALDNPLNDNREFVKAWKDARAIAHKRYEIIEKTIIKEALRTETPTTFIRRFFANQDVDNAKYLKAAISSKEWNEVKNTFTYMLLDSPDRLSERLAKDKLKPEFRNFMYSKNEYDILVRLGKEYDKFIEEGLDKTIVGSVSVGNVIEKLLEGNKTLQLKTLTSMIKNSGGSDGGLGRATRIALLENLYKQSLAKEFVELPGMEVGSRFLDVDLLKDNLKKYEKLGLYELLTTADIKTLGHLARVESFLKKAGSDAGTSLQGAETASALSKLRGTAFRNLFRLVGIGRLVTSKAGRRILLGQGRETTPTMRKIAALTGAMGVIAAETNNLEENTNKVRAIIE